MCQAQAAAETARSLWTLSLYGSRLLHRKQLSTRDPANRALYLIQAHDEGVPQALVVHYLTLHVLRDLHMYVVRT